MRPGRATLRGAIKRLGTWNPMLAAKVEQFRRTVVGLEKYARPSSRGDGVEVVIPRAVWTELIEAARGTRRRP